MLRVTVHGTSSDGTIPTASAVLKNMGHDDFKPTQLLNGKSCWKQNVKNKLFGVQTFDFGHT